MYPVWPSSSSYSPYPTAPRGLGLMRQDSLYSPPMGYRPYYATSPQAWGQGGANFMGWMPNIPLMPLEQADYHSAWPEYEADSVDQWQPQYRPQPEPEPEPQEPPKHWTPPQYRDEQNPALLKSEVESALAQAKKEAEAALPTESKQPENKIEAKNEQFEWKEAARHFKDGFISPAISMWQNKKKTLAGIALGGSLLMLTRGLILPVFTALGFVVTGVQLGGGLYKIVKEQNPDLKERAFYNFGAASSTLLLNAISGFAGGLKRLIQTQDDLVDAGLLTDKLTSVTMAEAESMRGLKSPLAIWETLKASPKCLAESGKRLVSPSHWWDIAKEKAKGATQLHVTIADGIKSTFSQGGIIGSLMMVLRHLASGYEVISDAHVDITNLPTLTPQQRAYLRKQMQLRAQQIGQLPGNLSNINWNVPTLPNIRQFAPWQP